jgi:PAS domain S-box-containing protein
MFEDSIEEKRRLRQRLKDLEKALRESEEKYLIIFSNPIYAICIFDLETLQLLEVNDAYALMYGYSREELLSGMTIHDITAEHEASDSATRRAIREGTIFLPLRYHRRKNGTVFPVEIVGGPYIWKGRKVMFALAHDITERKLAEAAQSRSQKLFADIFRVSPAATILSSLEDGRCVDANEAYAKLTGYPREELIGKTTVELNIWLSAEERRRAVVELAQKGHLENVELTLRRKNGEFISTLSSGEIITLDGQRFILSFFFDITEQRRAEQGLRESERRYRLLAENARDVIWTMNWPSLQLTYISPSIIHLRGYTAEEAMAEKFEEAFTPESFTWVQKARSEELTQEGGETKDLARTRMMELEYRCKDGSTAWGESRISAIRDARGNVAEILGVTRNITERKAAEEALRQRTLELQELNRTLETRVQERTGELAKANEALRHLSTRLLSVQEDERKRITRDLHDQCGKNLTALRFGLEKFQKALPDERRARDTFEDVLGLIRRLGDDIRNIASDLRPDTLDHFGLIPTLEWYINKLSSRIPEIRIDLQISGFKRRLSPETEVVLYRVIQEGLTNVLKHAEARNVKILLTYSHPRVILTMRDDGKGFAEKKVLSPSRIGKGGIGLLGMRERVSSLGGMINIMSEKGKGTLIRIEVPGSEKRRDAQNKDPHR